MSDNYEMKIGDLNDELNDKALEIERLKKLVIDLKAKNIREHEGDKE